MNVEELMREFGLAADEAIAVLKAEIAAREAEFEIRKKEKDDEYALIAMVEEEKRNNDMAYCNENDLEDADYTEEEGDDEDFEEDDEEDFEEDDENEDYDWFYDSVGVD